MTRLATYRDRFPNARLSRSESGGLAVALHTDGGTLVFNEHTHEHFVDLFHAIGSDHDNRVVILAGSGEAFMESISPETDEAQGFMKALVSGDDDRILGLTMIGSEAGEVVTVVHTAMLAHLPYPRLRDADIAHLTVAEGLGPLFSNVPTR